MNNSQKQKSKGKEAFYVVTVIALLSSSLWLYSKPMNSSKIADNEEKLAIDFVAHDLSGNEFKGSTLLGKTVLLDFWAVWCAPCITAFPELNKLEEELKDKNFEVIGIALYSGNSEDIQATLDQHNVDYRILIGDNDVMSQRYRIIGFPTYYLITPDGAIFKKYVGVLPDLFERIKSDVVEVNAKQKQAALIKE